MAKEFDWHKVKYLESTNNIKSSLLKCSERKISTGLANNIMTCIQQGRCFFEQAKDAPLEIKPLLIYYGMVGFAKAVVLAREMRKIESLPRSHGLSDVSDDNVLIEELKLKFNSNGTFQSFNDTLRGIEKVILHDGPTVKKFNIPTCASTSLVSAEINLKSILKRIPGLGKHYSEVFVDNPGYLRCSHFNCGSAGYEFQVFINETFSTEGELRIILKRLKEEYRFLNKWSFECASWAGGFASIKYSSLDPSGFGVLPDEALISDKYGFRRDIYLDYSVHNHGYADTILKELPPISGNLNDGDTHLIKPFDGLYFSEMSLFYMGMFLLGSLVRYKPNIWSNSIGFYPEFTDTSKKPIVAQRSVYA